MKKIAFLVLNLLLLSCGNQYDRLEISPADWRYKRVNYKQIYTKDAVQYYIIFTYGGEFCPVSIEKYNWAQKNYFVFCDYWYDKPLSDLTANEHVTN